MEPLAIRLVDDEAEGGASGLAGGRQGDRLHLGAADLARTTGWELKPQGLCRGDVCVPVRDRSSLESGGWIDLLAVADATGHPIAVDAPTGFVAVGTPAAERASALATLEAPDVRLPTVGGGEAGVRDLSGRKRLVVSFASWCGCRHDLGAWQALHERWAEDGFSVVGVAVDQRPEDVQPWIDEAGATFPVLLDADHRFVDAYGIVNVPTVVWVDEEDRIVQPNRPAFGDDQFVEFHGVPSAPHLEALERWVVDGEEPFPDASAVRDAQPLPDARAQQARTEFRLALALHRAGESDAAASHFAEAGRLAPFDFTIRRAAMPLQGQDPFGEPFFELYDEWAAAGRPYH